MNIVPKSFWRDQLSPNSRHFSLSATQQSPSVLWRTDDSVHFPISCSFRPGVTRVKLHIQTYFSFKPWLECCRPFPIHAQTVRRPDGRATELCLHERREQLIWIEDRDRKRRRSSTIATNQKCSWYAASFVRHHQRGARGVVDLGRDSVVLDSTWFNVANRKTTTIKTICEPIFSTKGFATDTSSFVIPIDE